MSARVQELKKKSLTNASPPNILLRIGKHLPSQQFQELERLRSGFLRKILVTYQRTLQEAMKASIPDIAHADINKRKGVFFRKIFRAFIMNFD